MASPSFILYLKKLSGSIGIGGKGENTFQKIKWDSSGVRGRFMTGLFRNRVLEKHGKQCLL